MNLIEHINLFSKCQSTLDLDLSLFEGMPFYVYAKDVSGKYIGMNHALVRDLGLNKAEDFLGHMDSDMPFLTIDEARNLKKNDEKVIASNVAQNYLERVTIFDGTKINLVSYKAPLLSRNQKKLGLIGISLLQSVIDYPKFNLTNRQIDCLILLVKGMTFKEIAKALELSPRTVEHYIETIKAKFKCETRSELIIKALKLEIIKSRL